MSAGSLGPVIGQQIVLLDREVLAALIDTVTNHPRRAVRRFDLGVSPATSCVIESIEEITVRQLLTPRFIAQGYCTGYAGSRRFVLNFNDDAGQLFVTLETAATVSGSHLRVQPLGGSPYMLAVDLDVNEAARETLRSCNSRGGRVRGEIGYQWCALPFADAGNVCSDSSECEGLCLLPSGTFLEAEAPASGVCQAETPGPFDCISTVANGKPGGTYCP